MVSGLWIKLLPVVECPPGRGRFVEAGGHRLCIFHLVDPERFIVTQSDCPHAGGNLAEGEVHGAVVTCSWHHWSFNLQTGQCLVSPGAKLRIYLSRVKEGYVWAKLSATASSGESGPLRRRRGAGDS